MAEFPAPASGILLAHFIVSDDVERSRRYEEVVATGLGTGNANVGDADRDGIWTGELPDHGAPGNT
jgi:hypothetical protein